jgi:hypothetical protein
MVVAVAVLAGPGCDDLGLFGLRPDASEDVASLGIVTFHAMSVIDPRVGPDEPGIDVSQRFSIEARFVRYDEALEPEVREVLGLADLDALPALDACAPDRSAVDAGGVAIGPPAAGGAGIELLNVGPIVVRGAAREQPLAVHTFPDLLDVMSGVIYGGASTLPFQPGRRYDVRGESDRTPWVAVSAPPGWEDLRVNGTPAREGLVGAFDADRQLELRWIPWPDRSSDVVVVLTWAGAEGASRNLVCHPADDGAFGVLPEVADFIPSASEAPDLLLRVERVVRVSFPMDRVDEAEAVFRVSTTTSLR